MQTFLYSNLPKECFIHENKQYILKGFFPSELPHVNLKYEGILKANNIPYRKKLNYLNVEICEYWNPTIPLKESVLSLPLFAKVGNGYVYCNKQHSTSIISSETIEAAKETEKFVKQEIKNYEIILREVEQYRTAKSLLEGKIATFNFGFPIASFQFLGQININMNKDMFRVLFIPNSLWFALFDMNKVTPNGYITLQVPKNQVGLVIGKGGSNIKYWAEIIGVKKINVVPI